MTALILASSSASRKNLLARLQLSFQAIAPDVDETPHTNETAPALAQRLAAEKAQKIAAQFSGTNTLIIGADQVILMGTTRLDKPGTVEKAIQQLQQVSGKKIDSYTGLCVINAQTGKQQLGLEMYHVTFRSLDADTIVRYVERDQPLQAAGSIKAESLGIALFTGMYGRDPTALLGLPLMLLTDMLSAEGIMVV